MNYMSMNKIRNAIYDKAANLSLDFLSITVPGAGCHLRIGAYDLVQFEMRAVTLKQFEITIDIVLRPDHFTDEIRKQAIDNFIIKRFDRNQCGIDGLFKFLASILSSKIMTMVLDGYAVGDPIPLPLKKEPTIDGKVYNMTECSRVEIIGIVAISGNKVAVGSDVIMTPGQKTWMLITIRGGAIITDGEAWYSAAQIKYYSNDYLILNENIFNFKFTGWDTEILHYIVQSYLNRPCLSRD